MTFIDDKIKALSEAEGKRFQETWKAVSSSSSWMSLRGFDENSSEDMMKLVLYREMYENDFSYLHRD